jgi:Xaa-Pro aminopeptidase
MADERTLRTAQAGAAAGADWAIVTAPDAFYYACQVETIIETGPSPFAGGPVLAIVARDGTLGVVVSDLDEAAARGRSPDVLVTYRGLDLHDRSPVEGRFRRAADQALRTLDVRGTVAIQEATFPWTVGELLAERRVSIVAIDEELSRQRSTKTAAEVERLRWCAHLTDLGQAAALRGSRPGRSELEVWADVRLAMEAAAGMRLPVAGDLISGIEATAAISGWPTSRAIQEGDPVLCDLAPRSRGYWGDSCNTIVVGEPPAGFSNLYRATTEALQVACEQLRPGITAGELDRCVRSVFESHGVDDPIHIGHGIGTGVHEWPRIVPGAPAVIREDMVLMLEPGAYAAGVGGVRLEWMFLVTASGNEVLSGFPHATAPPAPEEDVR